MNKWDINHIIQYRIYLNCLIILNTQYEILICILHVRWCKSICLVGLFKNKVVNKVFQCKCSYHNVIMIWNNSTWRFYYLKLFYKNPIMNNMLLYYEYLTTLKVQKQWGLWYFSHLLFSWWTNILIEYEAKETILRNS